MDEAARKKTLRMVPYALYLMGTRRADPRGPEDLHAHVVSWVTQVSFKPPMIVVGVGRQSYAHELLAESGVFSLNFLGSDQKDVAKAFFKDQPRSPTHFGDEPYEPGPVTGCPLFTSLPASLECRVAHRYEDANDHAVVVAEVVGVTHRREAAPLTTGSTGWTYAG